MIPIIAILDVNLKKFTTRIISPPVIYADTLNLCVCGRKIRRRIKFSAVCVVLNNEGDHHD